jgi:hypothetical protein
MPVHSRRPQLPRHALALAVAALLGAAMATPASALPWHSGARPLAAGMSWARALLTPADIIIGDGGIDSYTNSDAIDDIVGNLVLGNQASGDGTYTLTGNTAQTRIAFQAGGNGGNANGALIIGNAGQGSFIQGLIDGSDGGNQVHVAGDLVLGQQPGSAGSYTLNSGALSVGGQIAVGGQSTGSSVFVQNGGSVVLTALASSDPDYVPVGGAGAAPWGGALAIGGGVGNGDGSNSGGSGSYFLNAGSINTYNLLVGPSGTGTLWQSGGSLTTTFMTIGFSGNGTYNLSGGTLNSYSGAVGYAGSGVFNQSGGVVTIATDLVIGSQYASNTPGSGLYNLSGGTLHSGNTTVGDGEQGDFVFTGGTHNVTGNLVVGDQAAGVGTYTITGNASQLNIGFVPGGNTGTASNGSAISGNGALIVGNAGNGSFTQGLIDQSDAGNQVNVAGDLVLGAQGGSVGAYALNAGTLTVGGVLVIGSGSNGANVFTQNGGAVVLTGLAAGNADYAPVNGNAVPATYPGTLYVGGESVFNNGSGSYVMNGGTLSAPSILVGFSGTGSFQHSGGQVFTAYLDIGDCGGCNGGNAAGFYTLGGSGTLNAGNINIGDFGHGEFLQTGAASVNTVSGTLSIGNGPAAIPNTANPGNWDRSGLYTLQDGLLSTQYTIVGAQGTGSFVHSGGTHAVALTLTLGQQSPSLSDPTDPGDPVFGGPAPGLYRMSGGLLSVGGDPGNGNAALIVGDAGNGSFVHTGGLVTLGSWYDGQVLATGAVVGTASAGNLVVGASGSGSYRLGATGQPNSVAWGGYPGGAPGTAPPSFDAAVNAPWLQVFGDAVIARDAGANGHFVLAGDGSTLWVNHVANSGSGGTLAVGLGGTGSFTQSDASTVYLDGGLAIGVNSAAVGTYALNGGVLSVGGDLNIGGSDDASGGPLSQTSVGAGSGSFVQAAGAVTVFGHLSIATNPGATGQYTLAGGSLDVNGPAYLGNNGGNGSFVHVGGSATLGALFLGTTPADGPASQGRYVIAGNSSTLTVLGDSVIAAAPGTGGSSMTIGSGADAPSVNFNGYLTVGAADQGSLTIQSGNVVVGASTYVGGSPTGVGSIVQSGGSFTTGYLDIGTVTGGGSPDNSVTLTGFGTLTVQANMVIGSGTAGGNPDGSGGSFNQSGASVAQVQGSVYVNNGSIHLSGGSFGVGGNVVLGDTKGGAQFVQTGAAASVGGDLLVGSSAGRSGSYGLSGGGTLDVAGFSFVGAAGDGSFVNDGGAHSTAMLVVGQLGGSSGSYTLSNGGSLFVARPGTGGFVDVGESGAGTFTQAGGSTQIVGALDVGRFAGATGPGTLNVSGGTVQVTVDAGSGYGGFVVVGDAGVGVANHSGGNITVAGSLVIGRDVGGKGTWNASGGSLGVGGAITVQSVAGSTGMLNLSGGEITAASLSNSGMLNYSGGSLALDAGAGSLSNNAGGQINIGGARLLTGSLSNAGKLAASAPTDQLSVSGSFVQTALGSLDVLLGGDAGASLLSITGMATLDGTLDLICVGTCTYAPGTTITLLTAGGGVFGTFAGAPVLTGFAPDTFSVDYSVPGEVLLRVAAVPEPQTYAMFLGGLALLAFLARRRRD